MLLTLLLSTLALAYDLPTLSVDLDRDGRADTVRVLEGAADGDFHVLEISLSSSDRGSPERFERIVARLYDEMSDKKKEERSTCSSMQSRELVAGPNGAVLVKESGGSYDACAGSWYRTLEIRYVNSQLKVTRLLAGNDSWSMGDPSPTLDLSFNFAASKLSGTASDHHMSQQKPAKGAVPLSCGGAVPLYEFERQEFPKCAIVAAYSLSKKINMDCGRAYYTNSCPVDERDILK